MQQYHYARSVVGDGQVWQIASKNLNSRLFLGTALFPSPEVMKHAIVASGASVVTVSLRRQSPDTQGGLKFWEIVKSLNVAVLPNTAGCRTAQEAITLAHMARELFQTNWIKLEVIGDDYTLQPDPLELIKAATTLLADGFEVFPYTTADLIVAKYLVEAGCKILMPWAAPIGSGQGINDPKALKTLRTRLPDVTLIIDAGLGKPSHATQVMEMGYDGVLVNSAIALAQDPEKMAKAFSFAVQAGFQGFSAGLMNERELAAPSTPTVGTPFWHQHKPQFSKSSP